MKNYICLFLFLSVLITVSYAQIPRFSCDAIAVKGLTAKDLKDNSNIKIRENEKIKFISWRSNKTTEDPIYGQSTSIIPEFIIEYNNNECSIEMNDIKKIEFTAPINIKEFWEIFSLHFEVIENLAKNGVRYDLRSELDEESINFLNVLSQNNLIYKDEFIEDYIQSLIFKIHPGGIDDKRPGTLNLILYNESNPNAFCLPNGSICITTGLLSVIESEDELMGVLAHEIAHFVGDHHINNILLKEKRVRRAEFWSGVATALAGIAEAYVASKNEYYDFGTLTYSTAIISTEIAKTMVERFGMEYNHEQEFAADEAAFEVMQFLNKKPEAYVSALTKIGNYLYRTGNYESIQNSHTHPSLDSRLAKLDAKPNNYFSKDYQIKMSFVNTNNAKIEYNKKHFIECEKLVDKNINAGVATEDDYILKAMSIRIMHSDEEHNLIALDYLEKAEELNLEPNSYVSKQKAITYMRLGQMDKAQSSFERYLENLTSIYNEKEDISVVEKQSLKDEISWTKRMIFKSGV